MTYNSGMSLFKLTIKVNRLAILHVCMYMYIYILPMIDMLHCKQLQILQIATWIATNLHDTLGRVCNAHLFAQE